MIIEHMKKASHELSEHIAQYQNDQKPLKMTFINGYFFRKRLFYVFRVTLREYMPDFIGIVGGYKSFDPAEHALILNAQYNFNEALAHPLIRMLCNKNTELHDLVTLFYQPQRKIEIEGPDNRLVETLYHFQPSLSLDIETNSPSPDFAFDAHVLDYKTIRPEHNFVDTTTLQLAKFSFTHVLLKTSSFSVEDFIDLFEKLWSERLRPDNYNIRASVLHPNPQKQPYEKLRKQNKHFTFEIDRELILSININQSAKFIKDYARKYNPSFMEPNLKQFASKTHKTLQVSCITYKGTLISATRYMVKAVCALCELFNAQAVVTNNFVYHAKAYKEAALASLDASMDYFSWFPTFNIVGCKIKILNHHEKLCGSTQGMKRFNLLEIFVPDSDLQAMQILNLLNTIARYSFAHKGDIANKHFHIKELDCTVYTTIETSHRTGERYIMARIEGQEVKPVVIDIKSLKRSKRSRER